MIIGICTLEIFIYGASSLKDKRTILKSIIEKSKNKFNISIAEVSENNKWQKSVIGFTTVSNDKKVVDRTLEKVINFIDNFEEIEILNIEEEIL